MTHNLYGLLSFLFSSFSRLLFIGISVTHSLTSCSKLPVTANGFGNYQHVLSLFLPFLLKRSIIQGLNILNRYYTVLLPIKNQMLTTRSKRLKTQYSIF